MKKNYLFLPLLLLMLAVLFFPDASFAGKVEQLPNPLGTDGAAIDPRLLIGRVIGAILGIVGSLALAIFIYGGFLWMTSAGNQDKVNKGRQLIVWAVLGIAIIFTSYAIISFIIGAFTGGEGPVGTGTEKTGKGTEASGE